MKSIRESSNKELESLSKEINTNIYNKKYLHAQHQDYSLINNLSSANDGFRNKWFTILDDSYAVGFIQLTRLSYRSRASFGIIILKEYQRSGYGLMAMKEFFKLCGDIGIESIECVTTNNKLEYFYHNKLGMRKVGKFRNKRKLMNGKIYDELMFEKKLKTTKKRK